MRRFVAAIMVAGLLAACGADQIQSAAPEMSQGYGGAEDAARMAAPAPIAAQDAVAGEAAPPQTPQPGASPSPILFLAYSYNVGLQLPSQRLTGVVEAHAQACAAAGPRLCQLIGSNVSGDPESYIEGYVSLRGEPAWLRTFMGGLQAQADAAGGRITSQATNTEDLTRQIVDTESRLTALTTLRGRLQDLLRNRQGRLADLLEVERELARVQGEIDSMQSTLAVMRTRVAMSELTLSYRSAPRPVGSDTFEPLRQAFASFLGIIVGGFAVIISLIAGLIPVAVVAVPIVWLLLRWRRKRGGRFFNRAPPPAPPAS